MSFVAIAAVVTAGTAAYGAYSASQGPDDASAVFGKKPKIAPFTPIDLSEEQKKASASNLENADSITALLDKLMPGFSDLIKQGLDTSAALGRGEIPEDVQAAIMRGNAFDSMMGGFGGTQMASARTARDLGRTSLDLMQVGQNSAQQWAKLAETSYDPFMIKTKDSVAAAAANNLGQQETFQRQFNVDAAPDPAAAGQYNLDLAQNQALQQSLSQFGSILSTLSRSNQGGSLSSSYRNWSGAAPYATNPGSFGVPRAQPVYQYNPTSGTYMTVGG